jgi:hypothetical protein
MKLSFVSRLFILICLFAAPFGASRSSAQNNKQHILNFFNQVEWSFVGDGFMKANMLFAEDDKIYVSVSPIGELKTETLYNYLKALSECVEKADAEVVPGSITATVKITSPQKEVPIRVIPKNYDKIVFGKAIKSISTDVNKVTVYGDSAKLDKITYIPVYVDVSDLEESIEDISNKIDIGPGENGTVVVTDEDGLARSSKQIGGSTLSESDDNLLATEEAVRNALLWQIV